MQKAWDLGQKAWDLGQEKRTIYHSQQSSHRELTHLPWFPRPPFPWPCTEVLVVPAHQRAPCVFQERNPKRREAEPFLMGSKQAHSLLQGQTSFLRGKAASQPALCSEGDTVSTFQSIHLPRLLTIKKKNLWEETLKQRELVPLLARYAET